jgi:hypothetical protein
MGTRLEGLYEKRKQIVLKAFALTKQKERIGKQIESNNKAREQIDTEIIAERNKNSKLKTR